MKFVLINAGSRLNAGSPINAGLKINHYRIISSVLCAVDAMLPIYMSVSVAVVCQRGRMVKARAPGSKQVRRPGFKPGADRKTKP